MNKFFANNRILLSRIVAIIIFIVVIISSPKLYNTLWYDVFFVLGAILVMIGILGRIFASIFMSDNRNRKLVATGLYSITRNPLYLFSFIGTIGVCLVYGSIILTIIISFLYLFYYHYVISFEQKDLTKKIGQDYIDYLNSGTPKFFPKFSRWQSDEYLTVNYKVVLQTILDAFWFFFIILIIYVLLKLKAIEIIPTLYYIL